MYNLPFQSTMAIVAAVVEEPPDARASEYRPDVPGISDRRTGAFLLVI